MLSCYRMPLCGRRKFPLVVLQCWNHHLSLPRVGAVDGFGVVAKGFLGEALGVAGGFGAFGPGVAVGVERDAFDAKPAAGAAEFRRPVRFAHGLELGK